MNKLFDFDKKIKNSVFLIGTDEAGRGPLAGPVVASAVCFKTISKDLIKKMELLNDSKQLTPQKREALFEIITKHSIYSITEIGVEEIEKINILQASLKAMKISCKNIIKQIGENTEVIIDGNKLIPNFEYKQQFIVKGDGKSASIAAASILSKVYRDNLMKKYAEQFPDYDWENNKGYGTKKHIEAIKQYGVSPFHRKSFLKKIFEQENTIQTKLEL